ncbi:MAG TPA: ferredoxin [Armatimonadota bacterium]|nr:ferredoxin [Armatimonadota bacterium]HOS43031.1 ferredoxin [Armatimonadota bacterium]
MKVRVDRNLCRGVGSCVAIAPGAFQFDADRKAVLIEPRDADDDALWRAAESCPYHAIILEDAATGEWLYP